VLIALAQFQLLKNVAHARGLSRKLMTVTVHSLNAKTSLKNQNVQNAVLSRNSAILIKTVAQCTNANVQMNSAQQVLTLNRSLTKPTQSAHRLPAVPLATAVLTTISLTGTWMRSSATAKTLNLSTHVRLTSVTQLLVKSGNTLSSIQRKSAQLLQLLPKTLIKASSTNTKRTTANAAVLGRGLHASAATKIKLKRLAQL
jgi:hypothetical protein